jgi:hypothetical protein
MPGDDGEVLIKRRRRSKPEKECEKREKCERIHERKKKKKNVCR